MSAFNGAGTFVISGVGLPYVTGTTISSTVANQLNTDLATGLSTCITKDGQTLPTANLPMGGFNFTGMGPATGAGMPLIYNQDNARLTRLGLGMAPANILDITQNVAGNATAQIMNNDAGNTSLARFVAYNGTRSSIFAQLGQNFATNGILVPGGTAIQSGGDLALNCGGRIRIGVNGSTNEVITIDTAGRLSLNAQPRFHCYRSGTAALTANAYNDIAFDQTLYSVGGGLASGVYTAPVSGTYLFSYATAIQGLVNGSEFENMLVGPGGNTYYSWFTGSTQGWGASGCAAGTCIVNMSAGQTAFVRVYIGGTASIMGGSSGPHAWFAGQLIA